MKIINIEVNNRKKTFSVNTGNSTYSYPFAKLNPVPLKNNPLTNFWIDKDFGENAFSYELKDGKTGTVHIDHVLEYNRDPNYMTDVVKKKRHQVKQHSIQVLFYIKKALAKIPYFVISFMPDRGIRQCWEAT